MSARRESLGDVRCNHGDITTCPEHGPTPEQDRFAEFQRAERYREALKRAAFVAEHLMQMIDRETWRATGGDDGQGHYEGDRHAEQTAREIQRWKEMANQ